MEFVDSISKQKRSNITMMSMLKFLLLALVIPLYSATDIGGWLSKRSSLTYSVRYFGRSSFRRTCDASTSADRITNKNRRTFIKSSTIILGIRGGDDEGTDDEYDGLEEYDEYDDEYDDDDDGFNYSELDEADSNDFKEDNWINRFCDEFEKTPPLTKAYLTSSFVATCLGYAFTNNEFPPILTLDWTMVLKSFQFWRPFTAFLNLGSLGLISYPLSIHFVHQYMSSLERSSHNKPYDFWIMILFGMTSMLIGYSIMKVNSRFLGHNISTFCVYIWSRMYEGVDVNVFDFLNIKAETLPWFMIGQTYLLEGEPPLLDFLGIIFGHVYYHLKQNGILTAPKWLRNWYSLSPSAKALRDKYKAISSHYEVAAD